MRTRSHRTPARRALTLVETIAALVILATAIPPLLWSLREASVARIDPTLASTARFLAIERLEDIVADRLRPDLDFDDITEARYPDETAIEGFTGFSRQVRLRSVAPDLTTPGDDCLIATVQVAWSGRAGAARRLVLSTVLTEAAP